VKEGRVYLAHPGREAFISCERIQDSVIGNLEIIGEAARRVSPELRAELPDAGWPAIGAMRNILALDCVDVDCRGATISRFDCGCPATWGFTSQVRERVLAETAPLRAMTKSGLRES